MDIKKLVENGFIIYSEKDKISLEKRPTALNKRTIDNKLFENLEEAIDFIEEYLKIKQWKAIVRYNRGLGIEYKNLKVIEASTLDQAKIEAKLQAENLLGDYIIEIKVTENF